jgi:prevent-host-death family protein
MERIGVRELRQHASKHLERVERGESLEVTEHGRPVAWLIPVTGDHWRDLEARGLVSSATGDLLDVDPVVLPPGGPTASEVLETMRADER